MLLVIIAALGSGLMAGLYFVFSIAVMNALGRLSAAAGIAAMQSINKVIVNPLFLGVFFGTAVVSLVLAVDAILSWRTPGAMALLVASALYLGGNIVVTVVWNVPLNNALAAVDPDSAEGERVWALYLAHWTRWNHIRTFSCLAAMALLLVTLRVPGASP